MRSSASSKPFKLVGGSTESFRSVYIARYRWYPWRQKLVKNREARTLKNKALVPKVRLAEEAPYKKRSSEGPQFSFKIVEVSMSLRKLQNYARLLRHKHLQDGIDWIEAVSRPSAEPLMKLLKRAQKALVDEANLDPARLYIENALQETGYYKRNLFKKRDGGFSIRSSNRHRFVVKIREMPLNEFFHRVYILKKIPRAIVMDMASALRDGRAGPHMNRAFAPYVTAASRRQHRQELKYLELTRRFDYYAERKKWIAAYQDNIRRFTNRKREARGLGPLIAFPS